MTHTATHNGTCQACGRSQAVNPATGRLAKHGYTVEHGYFSGTCHGSDQLPLEVDTEVNRRVVASIRDWADRQSQKAAGEITTITIEVRDNERSGRGRTVYKKVEIDRAAFVEHKMTRYTHTSDESDLARLRVYASQDFDDEVDNVRRRLNRMAASARVDAANLEELRDQVHGRELAPRAAATAQQLRREYFRSYRDAHARQVELKAKGVKATVRGRAPSVTLTYRGEAA